MIDYPETPTLDSLEKIQDKSQVIGEFLEWLQESYTICEWVEEEGLRRGFYPVRRDIESWLSEFFNIDLMTAEKERQAVYDWMVRQNEK